MATASELFEARHYPGVVALISDALEGEPDCVPLLLVRARAQMALRRDLDAQADLRDIIRLDPQCSLAYRLLGELAARRDENESAAIFFSEALRLDPGDHEADTWLAIVQCTLPASGIASRTARPAAVAQKLPAPAAAAGRFPSPRFAKGTQSPDDERPTARFSVHRAELAAAARAGFDRIAPPNAQPVGRVALRPYRPVERTIRTAEASARTDVGERTPALGEHRVVPAPHAAQRSAIERPVARYGPDILTDRDIEALPPPPDVRFAAGSSSHLEAYRPQTGPHAPNGIAQPRHAGVFKAYPAESHTHDSIFVETEERLAPAPKPRHAHGEPASYARGSEPSVPNLAAAIDRVPRGVSDGGHVTMQGAQPVRRPLSQPSTSSLSSPATPRARGAVPELPGFGDYLVSTGILTRERLRAAQAYQRSMKVQLATAIVTLGLATPHRIEWAAVAHQSQLARGG
jgi:hypothetical protein